MGIKPLNKKGEYFRNNVWYWRRLWDFVCLVSDLDEKTHFRGNFNDGLTITGIRHREMVKNLELALKSKKDFSSWLRENKKRYEKTNREFLLKFHGKKASKMTEFNECPYPFSWENVESFLVFVKNNRGFRIW